MKSALILLLYTLQSLYRFSQRSLIKSLILTFTWVNFKTNNEGYFTPFLPAFHCPSSTHPQLHLKCNERVAGQKKTTSLLLHEYIHSPLTCGIIVFGLLLLYSMGLMGFMQYFPNKKLYGPSEILLVPCSQII